MPQHRRKAFIKFEQRQTISQGNPSIAEEGAFPLSPRFEGVVPSDDGALTLDLEVQPKTIHQSRRDYEHAR
jgi:hypothetical protein